MITENFQFIHFIVLIRKQFQKGSRSPYPTFLLNHPREVMAIDRRSFCPGLVLGFHILSFTLAFQFAHEHLQFMPLCFECVVTEYVALFSSEVSSNDRGWLPSWCQPSIYPSLSRDTFLASHYCCPRD